MGAKAKPTDPLDNVVGQYLSGDEIAELGGADFVVASLGTDTFRDGVKTVILGKLNGHDRKLVLNVTNAKTIRGWLGGKHSNALAGQTLVLKTVLARRPDGVEGPSIRVASVGE